MASILPLALINAEHSARAGVGEAWNVKKKLMCMCSERQREGNGWESKNLKQCSCLQGEQARMLCVRSMRRIDCAYKMAAVRVLTENGARWR